MFVHVALDINENKDRPIFVGVASSPKKARQLLVDYIDPRVWEALADNEGITIDEAKRNFLVYNDYSDELGVVVDYFYMD